MKRGKELEDLIEDIEYFIPYLVANKSEYENVCIHLNQYHMINRSVLAKVLNNPKQLEVYGEIFTGLIAQQIAVKIQSSSETLRLEEWFTDIEIEVINNYKHESEVIDDEIIFPLTLSNVDYLKPNVYQVAMDESMIARLRKYYLLKYDFLLQRDAIIVKRGNKNRERMNLNKKNILEMKELILKEELMPTAMVYNCTPFSGVNGEDLIYDEKTKELTIVEGAVLNILDGAHRTLAYYAAYKVDPELRNKVTVIITNFVDEEAQRFQVQLAKQTPINKARIRQLDAPTLANRIVNTLNQESIFRNKAATNNNRPVDSYYVHYDDLVMAFTVLWKVESQLDVQKVVESFKEYLLYFNDVLVKSKNNKILLHDKYLFVGHVALCKKMNEENISLNTLSIILDNVDWSDENEDLLKLKNEMIKSKSNKRSIYNIGKYFENII